MTTTEKQREALTEELKTRPICRFCLTQEPDELSNIYAKDSPLKSLVPLPVEVMAIASIEVFENDGMPSSVCINCRLIFGYCYRFKQMCKKAESLLNKVPLLGEWPAPLSKPVIPMELIPKNSTTQCKEEQKLSTELSAESIKYELKPKARQLSSVENTKALILRHQILAHNAVINPKKILNSNPAALPEPPVPKRKVTPYTINFLNKVENEEISRDDLQLLIAAEVGESGDGGSVGADDLNFSSSPSGTTKTTNPNTPKSKPKVLNKCSIRILNKEASLEVEPRLKQPFVKKDEDGNVSLVTEIIDPNEPFEAEPDPIKNAEPVETNLFPCPHCERTFPLKQLLDIHLVNHTRERQYPCTDCDRSFFSKYDLQKHVLVHTGERKYKCSVCDRGFTRPALLHRHEKIHTDKPKYLCVYCEKEFLSKDDMEKHTERHRKNRPHKCKICSKAFAFKQGLDRHEVIHSKDQPYPCQYCDKSFCTPSKLARHLVAHAGKRPYPCKYCSKSYLLSHHLSRHLRTHKEHVVMYSCTVCRSTYPNCEALVRHSVGHATQTLTCPLCQQGFEDAETAKVHVMAHTNESYPCEFCDLIFITNNEQTEHVKNLHAGDLAAYNEYLDATNYAQKSKKSIDDQAIQEVIEEFLIDDPAPDDDQKIDIPKQEVNEDNGEQWQQLQQTDHFDYGENYVQQEQQEYENTIDEEMLTDITLEQQQQEILPSKVKKLRTDDKGMKNPKDSNSALQQNETEAVQTRRKTTKRNTEEAGQNIPRKSPRNISANQIQSKQNKDGKDETPHSSSSGGPNLNQIEVKKEKGDKDENTGSPTKTSAVKVNTETTATGDTVVKMKLGERKVRVQKIVVTKAEAAAMAKQGRLCIKDGNLILASASSSSSRASK